MELKFANGMSEDEKKVEGTEGVEQPLKNGKKSGSEKNRRTKRGRKTQNASTFYDKVHKKKE